MLLFPESWSQAVVLGFGFLVWSGCDGRRGEATFGNLTFFFLRVGWRRPGNKVGWALRLGKRLDPLSVRFAAGTSVASALSLATMAKQSITRNGRAPLSINCDSIRPRELNSPNQAKQPRNGTLLSVVDQRLSAVQLQSIWKYGLDLRLGLCVAVLDGRRSTIRKNGRPSAEWLFLRVSLDFPWL